MRTLTVGLTLGFIVAVGCTHERTIPTSTTTTTSGPTMTTVTHEPMPSETAETNRTFEESGAAGTGAETPSTSAPRGTYNWVSNDIAIHDITNDRCDHERACNNVGSGNRYRDPDACALEIRHDTRASLRKQECPKGVSEPNLATCLHDIRTATCEKPIDTLDRIPACRKERLCG